MKKSLISLVKNLILEEQISAIEAEFIKKYVGSNDDKKISQEEFNEINQLFDKKFNIVRWMVLRIIENKILVSCVILLYVSQTILGLARSYSSTSWSRVHIS